MTSTLKRASALALFFCLLSLALPSSAQVRITGNGPQRCLSVNGRQMLMLAGELSNSAATCKSDIDSVLPRMSRLGLNTVLVPAQWDLTEPEEGKYDFSLIDETINVARQNNLKIVFLWFGAWKNSMSCYAPLWFKADTKRFPRAMTTAGKPLEIASAFSENILNADKKVFTALLRHIAAVDGDEHTVVMIQVENEIGMLESARDHSPLAEKSYKSGEWRKVVGSLNIPSGDVLAEDEAFQAYYYAKYVEQLAVAGKKILDIPFYVNAAMNSRGRKPGEYPSAGPLAHLFPVWKKVAPHIDLCAPDIYDTGFKSWAAKYATKDNVLFIPESRCCENSGVRALYTFGEHHAIGFGPFAIDEAPASQTGCVSAAYGLMRQLSNLLLNGNSNGKHHEAQGKEMKSWGVLFSQEDKERVIEDGNTVLTCRHNFTLPWDPRATNGQTWQEGGAYILRLAPNDYIIAGSGVVVVFQTKTEKEQAENVKTGEDGFAIAGQKNASSSDTRSGFKGNRLGIGFVDEININANGEMKYVRRENGDQDHQGRHARISVGDYKILHVKLYQY